MAANLTAGAIGKMLSGEVTTEKEMTPILQVTELNVIQQTRQNQESQERYKVSLSDGIQSQKGILNTTLNLLVKQGKIQIGSILRLTRFVSNSIQIRRVAIVMELEIIAEQCSIIGNPLPASPGKPRTSAQSSTDHTQQQQQPGAVSVNTQSNVGLSELSSGRVRHGGFEQQHDRRNELNGAVRYGSAQQHQVGERRASEFPETKPSARSFASSNAGYGSSRQEQSRAPPTPTAYSRPPAYQAQPPSMYANVGPVARNEAPPTVAPISSLNPYQNRWTIKVRVTSKGELRRFNGARGEGKVFSFDLVDSGGGEIRVTCFNDVVDKFFDVIVVGNVYLITKGNLKPARKEYNHLPNDYEIHLDNASMVQQCYEDDATIPRNQFYFKDICAIETMESNSIIDVIGIVFSISPTGSIMRKNGTEAQKRALQLKDMSGRSVEVTMWGNFCNAEGQRLQSLCDSGVFPVLAVKAGKISEFNGKQVSTIGSSQLVVEPDLPEARELRAWFEREGRNAPCISISREFTGAGRQEVRKVITQIKDENLGTSEKPDWITVSATISFMKVENFCYTACPIINGDRPCSKKVTNNGDGTWRCEKCDKCVDECDYRYILQLQLQDHTGVTWATAFQEAGEEIMGISAKDLYFMKNEDRDEEKFEDIVRKAAFTKYIFKLKVKEETFSDESRVKATVVKAEKLDYSSDTRSLLEAMNKLRAEDANPLTVNPESSSYRSGAFNSGIGTSGIRETSSVDVPRREFGLTAANQVNQFGNQHSSDSRPLGGVTLCDACGSNAHVFANCPSFLSEPQGQHMNSAYGNTQGRNAGGGMPRQHVGSY
ncbi:Replication protein A 70 kDa DNA-binding subunit C [Hirschfeldia incana]|nr:Replication protein A 70 kDa DNA-binding subunit C [Hirschfeldia incana]